MENELTVSLTNLRFRGTDGRVYRIAECDDEGRVKVDAVLVGNNGHAPEVEPAPPRPRWSLAGVRRSALVNKAVVPRTEAAVFDLLDRAAESGEWVVWSRHGTRTFKPPAGLLNQGFAYKSKNMSPDSTDDTKADVTVWIRYTGNTPVAL